MAAQAWVQWAEMLLLCKCQAEAAQVLALKELVPKELELELAQEQAQVLRHNLIPSPEWEEVWTQL